VIVHSIRGHCGIPLAPSHSLTTLFSSPPLLFLFSPPTHSVLLRLFFFFSHSFLFCPLLFSSFYIFFRKNLFFFFSLIFCYFPSLTLIILPAAFRSVATRLAHDGGWPDLDLVQLRALGQLQRFCTSLLCSYSTISIILTMTGAKTLQVSFSPRYFFFSLCCLVQHCRLPALSAQTPAMRPWITSIVRVLTRFKDARRPIIFGDRSLG
jgi:hypothetical protein